ncbi:hypothetical protein OBBRIDRAFT_667118 [Obba rivulosa]|uniref:Uncharacterized protein n=1 Tax=Obba rivulosa TaxID=1052685 RepID=A0A8E2AUG9_9APHY|nr:hypothetical protein OBBRIDRAFT_667118 [Obba rivulosa]
MGQTRRTNVIFHSSGNPTLACLDARGRQSDCMDSMRCAPSRPKYGHSLPLQAIWGFRVDINMMVMAMAIAAHGQAHLARGNSVAAPATLHDVSPSRLGSLRDGRLARAARRRVCYGAASGRQWNRGDIDWRGRREDVFPVQAVAALSTGAVRWKYGARHRCCADFDRRARHREATAIQDRPKARRKKTRTAHAAERRGCDGTKQGHADCRALRRCGAVRGSPVRVA